MELKQQIRDLKASTLLMQEEILNAKIGAETNTLVVDYDGIIIHSTQPAKTLFGYESLKDKALEELMPERFRGKHREHFKEYILNPVKKLMGQRMNLDILGITKDRQEIPLIIELMPNFEFVGNKYIKAVIIKK